MSRSAERYKQSARTSGGAEKWLDVRLFRSATDAVTSAKRAGYQARTPCMCLDASGGLRDMVIFMLTVPHEYSTDLRHDVCWHRQSQQIAGPRLLLCEETSHKSAALLLVLAHVSTVIAWDVMACILALPGQCVANTGDRDAPASRCTGRAGGRLERADCGCAWERARR